MCMPAIQDVNADIFDRLVDYFKVLYELDAYGHFNPFEWYKEVERRKEIARCLRFDNDSIREAMRLGKNLADAEMRRIAEEVKKVTIVPDDCDDCPF